MAGSQIPARHGHEREIAIVRRKPGPGYKHVVSVQALRRFIGLIPEWPVLSEGLDQIVLDAGTPDAMGWYRPGALGICAWPLHSGLWHEVEPTWLEENRSMLTRLDVVVDEADGRFGLLWTESQAQAFMLLDVFLHELGHHYDLITTRGRKDAARGEPFATAFRDRLVGVMWPEFQEAFLA